MFFFHFDIYSPDFLYVYYVCYMHNHNYFGMWLRDFLLLLYITFFLSFRESTHRRWQYMWVPICFCDLGNRRKCSSEDDDDDVLRGPIACECKQPEEEQQRNALYSRWGNVHCLQQGANRVLPPLNIRDLPWCPPPCALLSQMRRAEASFRERWKASPLAVLRPLAIPPSFPPVSPTSPAYSVPQPRN